MLHLRFTVFFFTNIKYHSNFMKLFHVKPCRGPSVWYVEKQLTKTPLFNRNPDRSHTCSLFGCIQAKSSAAGSCCDCEAVGVALNQHNGARCVTSSCLVCHFWINHWKMWLVARTVPPSPQWAFSFLFFFFLYRGFGQNERPSLKLNGTTCISAL